MEETSRRGILGRHRSCDSERIDILSDSIECNHLSRNTSSSLYIPKVVRLKTGEVLYEKAYMSPRPPPKISQRHDWTKELVSEVDRQPRGHLHVIHGAFSLTRSLPSSFTGPSCPSPSPSSIPSCTLSSTTRSSWQVCATPPQMRVRTP